MFTKQILNCLALNALRWARSNYSSKQTVMYICLVPFATKDLKSLALFMQLEGSEAIETDPAMIHSLTTVFKCCNPVKDALHFVAGAKMPQT